MGDINGDGCTDSVAFIGPLHRALGNCNGTFQNFVVATSDFGSSQGWDDALKYQRSIADITGDGRAHMVGFGAAGIYTANGQSNGLFPPMRFAFSDFGYNGGWRAGAPRALTDLIATTMRSREQDR